MDDEDPPGVGGNRRLVGDLLLAGDGVVAIFCVLTR